MNNNFLKKLILPAAICVLTIAPANTHAASFVWGNTVYEEFAEMNDLIDSLYNEPYTDKVFKSTNFEETDFDYVIGTYNQYGFAYSPLYVNFPFYSISESDAAKLSSYLSAAYPDVILNEVETGSAYSLDYGKETTMEEQLEIGLAIKDNLGLIFNIYTSEIALVDVKLLGDLDGDSTVNALDASLVLTYYSDSQTGGLDVYSDEEIQDISLLGDYDGDGTVDAIDASLVLKEYAETQTE